MLGGLPPRPRVRPCNPLQPPALRAPAGTRNPPHRRFPQREPDLSSWGFRGRVRIAQPGRATGDEAAAPAPGPGASTAERANPAFAAPENPGLRRHGEDPTAPDERSAWSRRRPGRFLRSPPALPRLITRRLPKPSRYSEAGSGSSCSSWQVLIKLLNQHLDEDQVWRLLHLSPVCMA